jgi:hypothetical protein
MAEKKESGGAVEISDPNNVAEVLVNGQFNVTRMGSMIVFTYTVVRLDTSTLFAQNATPPLKGVVAAHILMPVSMAEDLKRVLEQTLAPSEAVARHEELGPSRRIEQLAAHKLMLLGSRHGEDLDFEFAQSALAIR